MGFNDNKVDPCLYDQWTNDGLVIWVSWVSDCRYVGPKDLKSKLDLLQRVECKDAGEIKECVGCKIELGRNGQTLKMTKQVLCKVWLINLNQIKVAPINLLVLAPHCKRQWKSHHFLTPNNDNTVKEWTNYSI